MREVIKTGRTVEDATELALAELGVSAEEAGIEVLELPQRRLFKSIPAKVRAYVEDEEVPEAPAPKEEKPLPKAAPKAAELPDAPKAGAPAAQPEQAQPAAGPVEEPIDLEQNPKAREAVEYLKEICAKMGAQGLTITPVKQGEATILKVEGESAGTLIGHRGEVMEALSYLTSLVANRAGGPQIHGPECWCGPRIPRLCGAGAGRARRHGRRVLRGGRPCRLCRRGYPAGDGRWDWCWK